MTWKKLRVPVGGQAAFAEFPGLKNMTAAQIRAFGNTINRTASDLALQAAHRAYDAEQGN